MRSDLVSVLIVEVESDDLTVDLRAGDQEFQSATEGTVRATTTRRVRFADRQAADKAKALIKEKVVYMPDGRIHVTEGGSAWPAAAYCRADGSRQSSR